MDKTTSGKMVAVIEEEEGTVLRPYRDVGGVPTQGTGHTSAAGLPLVTMASAPWTPEYSRKVLENDLRKFEARVNAAMGATLQNEFDGGVSFDFNTGAINRASWVDLWKAGKMLDAGKSFRLWDKAGGKVVGGLVRRRGREWRIISTGDYSRLGTISNPPSVLSIADGGTRPNETEKLQEDLAALGYFEGVPTGYFAQKTEAAVKAFQKAHPDLTVDGRVGPATRAQIQRNLDLRSKVKGAAIAAPVAAGSVLSVEEIAGPQIDFAGLTPSIVVTLVLAAALTYLAVIGWKYRGEVAQFFNKRKI